MIQQEVITKAYESLIFLLPKLKASHRTIIEQHLSQVYVAGYELGIEHAPKAKPVLQFLEGEVVNRFPSAIIAHEKTGKSIAAIRYAIKTNCKSREGYTWKHSNN